APQLIVPSQDQVSILKWPGNYRGCTCESRSANPARNLESNLRVARRGISLCSARYHPYRVARGGAPLLASSFLRSIPRFFVPGGRAALHPIPGPPAPSETTTVTVAELCRANAPVAYPSSFTHPSDPPSDRS